MAAFRRGLSETGYVEGQNVAIEYRWAEGQYDRLPALAADLVSRQVAVIVAGAASGSARGEGGDHDHSDRLRIGGDPVKLGLVASLNRPGGNVTGVTFSPPSCGRSGWSYCASWCRRPRRSPCSSTRQCPNAETRARDCRRQRAHRARSCPECRSEREIDTAFATLVRTAGRRALVGADPFFYSRRDQIVALAARHAIPAIYRVREFAEAGGLMSYGASIAGAYRQVGIYAGRILKGEKPADLPVMQPTKFELVINLKTAKALGLDVPPTLLARADEVIE